MFGGKSGASVPDFFFIKSICYMLLSVLRLIIRIQDKVSL